MIQNKGPHDEQMIDLTIDIRAPLPKVWNAWTTNEGLESFFAPKSNIELVPGGLFEIWFMPEKPYGERGSDGMRILAIEPMTYLSFTWNAPPEFPTIRTQCTHVGLRFRQISDEITRLHFTETGWGESKEWQDVFGYFSEAWPSVLSNLKKVLEAA